MVEQIRIRVADDGIQRNVLSGNDEILQVDCTAEAVFIIDYINRSNVVIFTGLLYQLVHGLPNGQVLLDADIVGRDQAADFAVVIGIDKQDG